MIYYGHYNEDGEYRGFFTKEIHGDNIDAPNIELSEEQWQEALTGNFRVIDGAHTYVAPPENIDELKAYSILRSERNGLLSQCDWTQMPDAPLSNEKKQEWVNYRQQLRDLPDTVDINNIVYPQKPE
jgi:hypothetical protein